MKHILKIAAIFSATMMPIAAVAEDEVLERAYITGMLNKLDKPEQASLMAMLQ
jgi:hypothetical protein